MFSSQFRFDSLHILIGDKMPFTIKDIAYGVGGDNTTPTGGVTSLLANRTDLLERGLYGWIYDAILEISRDFRFENLEHTGPVVTLNQGQYSYAPDYLIQPADIGRVVNLEPSFVRYFNPFNGVPVPGQSTNASSTLKWKTIDALEMMFNTPGIPAYFTRYGGNFLVAPVPDGTYYSYLRYQVEHPFLPLPPASPPNPPFLANTPFLLPNEWKVIVEYWAAIKGASVLRQNDISASYHTTLFGDPEFQRSSGGRGQPGLIARRISQMEGDSTSMTRSIRVHVSQV
jgi:hypothetical protein